MDDIKNLKKQWHNSLVFLDNSILNSIIVVILLLYSSTIFENINVFIGNLYKFSIVKLIVILLIVYVSHKDTTIAILLAISYVVSLNYSLKENFTSSYTASHISSHTSSHEPSHRSSHEPSHRSSHNSSSKYNPLRTSQYSSISNPSSSSVNESFQAFPYQQPDIDYSDKLNYTETTNIASADSNNYINISKNNDKLNYTETSNNNNATKCNSYSKYEVINDICEPVNKLSNSLNTQGLNALEGYDIIDSGSPL